MIIKMFTYDFKSLGRRAHGAQGPTGPKELKSKWGSGTMEPKPRAEIAGSKRFSFILIIFYVLPFKKNIFE